MTNNVLYFPYIRVPQSAWFSRVLLYWDQVGSIVPYEYVSEPEKLGKYMQSLVSEGLVKQVFPGQYIDKIPNFEEAFLKCAEKHRDHIIGNLENMKTSKIHIEKMGNLADELCKMGLAKESNYPWYEVESVLANKFMAYLAGVLGNLNEVNSRPITDTFSDISIFESPGSTKSLVLENLLPAPSENVTVQEIANFKLQNRNYLIRFRNEVESFLIQMSNIEDERKRKEMIDRFLENSKDSINQLVDLMKSNKWNKISFGRLITYCVTGLTLADAIISGGLFSTIAAAFGLAGSAYSTYQESKKSYSLLNSNFVYAALASKELQST